MATVVIVEARGKVVGNDIIPVPAITADVADGDWYFVAKHVRHSDYEIISGDAYSNEGDARRAREAIGLASPKGRTRRVHVHQGKVTATQWCKS